MLFSYTAIDQSGRSLAGSIDAISSDVAINALQRRGLIPQTIAAAGAAPFWARDIAFFRRVRPKDVVILSRQLATLFGAQISALRIFRLLAAEAERPLLGTTLLAIADDLQAGSSIAKSLGKHPETFSRFYVSMVHSGEETGKLDRSFLFLADYLERVYEVTSRAKNALIYPLFVIITFIAVMVLMLTTVIPSVSGVLAESGAVIPATTRAILGVSFFFVHYGWFLLILVILGVLALWRFSKRPEGRYALARFITRVPYIGELFRKLFLSRIADTMHTQISSAIPIMQALEITGDVVGNAVFEDALRAAAGFVREGASVSDAFARSGAFPGIMVQMIKVGEESGELGSILETLGRFYRREVDNAVDRLVSLIEPVLIIALGLGVGFLLAAVLIPIYSIAGGG